MSSITATLRELLPNNTTHFSRYQAVLTFLESTVKQYTLFPSLHPAIPTPSVLLANDTTHFFSELTSNNTDIFRELLANNTTHFCRVYTKQYRHFQIVCSTLNYSKKFFQSWYHTILTLSKSYCQTMLTYFELIANSIHTFTELLPNSSTVKPVYNDHLRDKVSVVITERWSS